MLIYILKFSACLLVFMAFYKVFFEKTSYNQFKRFYLLSMICASICIPFITITEYIEPQIVSGDLTSETILNDGLTNSNIESINYFPLVLWSIYILGVLIFSVKFFRNLLHIVLKIKRNPKYKTSRFINVLLKDLVVPHTFFSYIFLNKSKFENNEIPSEIMLHEETHAKEKHSADTIFIELAQIIFWFNPLIYLVKKDIKLNHEFLADQAVIRDGTPPIKYQQLLLAFSSNASEPELANAINYSSIKKRLTIMKTQTKKKAFWSRSIFLIPLLALLVYGFSSKEEIERLDPTFSFEENSPIINTSNERHTARSISIEILNDGSYLIDNLKATKSSFVDIVNTLHQDITPDQRNNIMNIHVNGTDAISNEEVWFIYNSLQEYGFHRIVTTDQEVIRSKGNTPFAISNNDDQRGENFESIPVQKGASREQMKEYNTWAKKINKEIAAANENKGNAYPKIKLKDMERMKYIFSIMSEKQRQDAEPFPNIPPPPPPPPPKPMNKEELKALKEVEKAEYLKQQEEVKAKKLAIAKKQKEEYAYKVQEKQKYAEEQKAMKVKTKESKEKSKAAQAVLKAEKMKYKEEKAALAEAKKAEAAAYKARKEELKSTKLKKAKAAELAEVPPPPPPPKAPLDHVIDMAKSGAVFYYEGKKISSDEAIKIVKTNKKINISTKEVNSNTPKVYLSSKPIKIKSKQ